MGPLGFAWVLAGSGPGPCNFYGFWFCVVGPAFPWARVPLGFPESSLGPHWLLAGSGLGRGQNLSEPKPEPSGAKENLSEPKRSPAKPKKFLNKFAGCCPGALQSSMKIGFLAAGHAVPPDKYFGFKILVNGHNIRFQNTCQRAQQPPTYLSRGTTRNLAVPVDKYCETKILVNGHNIRFQTTCQRAQQPPKILVKGHNKESCCAR